MKAIHLKNIRKIGSVYAGAILGAGFASGREITQYFVCYGNNGFWGLILAGIIFGVVGWAIMSITYDNHIKGYRAFLNMLFGKVLGGVMETVSVLFMFVIFSTMLSAAGAISQQSSALSPKLAVFVVAIICGITLALDVKAIVWVNTIVSPLLLLGGICLGLYAFFQKTIPTFGLNVVGKENFFFSAVIYVAYNIITAVLVLTNMHASLSSKNVARYGGLLGGLSLGVMGICLGLGIMAHYNEIAHLEIPVLKIAESLNITVERIYLVMLILAVYTTASINGYAIMTWAFEKFKIKKSTFILLFIGAGFLMAQIEFSDFVAVIYPLFGYVGLIQMIVILTNFIIPCRLQSQ